MNLTAAIAAIRAFPDSSYMRCPFCGCKSPATHGQAGKPCILPGLEKCLADRETLAGDISHMAFLCHTHDDFGKGREKGLLDASKRIMEGI